MMSETPSNKPHKKKSHRKSEKNLHRILIVLMVFIVIFASVLVLYALRRDPGTPAIGRGTVRPAASQNTTPSTEPPTEPPTQPSSSSEETTEQPTEPETSPEMLWAQDTLEGMSLEERVYQLFVVTPTTLTGYIGVDAAGPTTQAALEENPVGGIIYFAENIYQENQIRTMIENSQSYSKIPLLICVDEEGGRVSRLSGIGVTDTLSPMAYYGEQGDTDAVYEIGKTLGEQITSVGFNVDFAPVADVVTNPNNTEIGDRSFSDDPAVAAEMVAAMVKGLQDGGAISCLKHFPGHGSTEADSHEGRSVTDRTLEELRRTELIPFRAGIEAGVEMVMLSHMSIPAITGDDTPCDLSPEIVTDLLRIELGFEGVIITDSHEMGAIRDEYECGEAAVLAIQAGCDIVLMPYDIEEAVEAVLAAIESGDLTEERINESVLRILAMKYRSGMVVQE